VDYSTLGFRSREPSPARRLGIMAALWIIGAVAFLAVFLWVLPTLLTMHPHVAGADRHKAINDARLGIASVLAVLATAGGFAYTIRTYRLSRRGQIADRYTKAVEQLSNTGSDIQIGGIYALEQTARDASEYQRTVIDVLAAHIRSRAPWPPLPAPISLRFRCLQRRSQVQPVLPGPNIQVAMDVLRRLVRQVGKRDIDLRHTNLADVDLMDMYLWDAQLSAANLTRAKLNGADLRGADLRGAELRDAQLYQANFSEVKMWRGQVSEEDLTQVEGLESVQWSDPPSGADHKSSLIDRLLKPWSNGTQ
jgi:Pentapeptide repeats (8 copies)